MRIQREALVLGLRRVGAAAPWLVAAAASSVALVTLLRPAVTVHVAAPAAPAPAPATVAAAAPAPATGACPEPAPAAPEALPVEVPAVYELPFDGAALDPRMTYPGTLVGGARWHDSRGDNVLLLTERRFRNGGKHSHLVALHYREDAFGEVHLVRRVQELDGPCGDDLVSSFHRAPPIVTDLDADGLGEVTFGYFHGGCMTDVSPAFFKLFLLRDGDKYVLRGGDYLRDLDPPTVPTEGAELARGPAFARHLRAWWPWLADRTGPHALP
jgi:hypothetical protein